MRREDLPEHLQDLWNPAELVSSPLLRGGVVESAGDLREQVRLSLAYYARKDVRVVEVIADEARMVVLVLLEGALTDVVYRELLASVRAVAPHFVSIRLVAAVGEDLAAYEAAWRLGGVEAIAAIESAIRLGADPETTVSAFFEGIDPKSDDGA